MTGHGKLFVFEGQDGVGKTTLSKWFAKNLQTQGTRPVIWSSFPGNERGSLGKLVYKLHHKPSGLGVKSLRPVSLQLCHIAAHIDAIESRFAKSIRSGATVVLDRFWWSTWVYGRFNGGDPVVLDKMIELEKLAWGKIKPEKLFFITRCISKCSKRHQRLNQLYAQLARKESRIVPVECVSNDGVLESTQKLILSALL